MWAHILWNRIYSLHSWIATADLLKYCAICCPTGYCGHVIWPRSSSTLCLWLSEPTLTVLFFVNYFVYKTRIYAIANFCNVIRKAGGRGVSVAYKMRSGPPRRRRLLANQEFASWIWFCLEEVPAHGCVLYLVEKWRQEGWPGGSVSRAECNGATGAACSLLPKCCPRLIRLRCYRLSCSMREIS